MSSWLSFVLMAGVAIAITHGRSIDPEPVSVMMDIHGNPIVFLRDKRAPIGYPQRTMMFSGYYRPERRTNEQQVAGVYAQGNAVSGGSYIDGGQTDYLQRGPEPANEPEISSSEAEAAPNPLEHHVDVEQDDYKPKKEQQEQEESHSIQEQEQGPSDAVTKAPVVDDSTKISSPPTRKQGVKKTKTKPIAVESEESDESEDEDDENEENDDETGVPFVQFKSNRRTSNIPNLNNFFPIVFSYPRGVSRGYSPDSDSPSGMITAIANSYSTGKGGVASSVATAYGGSPQGKKHRRAQPALE